MYQGHRCYRMILKDAFTERAELNPLYSLRAFARDLKISPASLTEIFKGKQGLSLKKAQQISQKLDLNSGDSQYFCALVESQHARSKIKKEAALKKLKKLQIASFTELQEEYLSILSKWHYFAILELTYLNDFQPDPKWISQKLGLNQKEIEASIKKLFKLGLLKEENGNWRDAEKNLATSNDIPSNIIRRLHAQFLVKAHDSLSNQSVEERDFQSLVLAINKRDIPKFKKMLRDFKRRSLDFFDQSENKDELYCFSMQFFNLTVKT